MPAWRFHARTAAGWADLPDHHNGDLPPVLIRCGELAAELGGDVCGEPLTAEDEMDIDRKRFFDAVRDKPFGGSLTASQVAGMEALLDAAPPDMPAEHVAYVLASAKHETAHTMQPIKEYGGQAYFHKMYDPKGSRPHVARALGNVLPGDGAKYAGRGYVQITGRRNYGLAAELTKVPLLDDPDGALHPDTAATIIFAGMAEGWFTGKKLSDYFGPGKSDPINARRIVNGTDKAALIAGHHRDFLAAIKASPARPTLPLPKPDNMGPGYVEPMPARVPPQSEVPPALARHQSEAPPILTSASGALKPAYPGADRPPVPAKPGPPDPPKPATIVEPPRPARDGGFLSALLSLFTTKARP